MKRKNNGIFYVVISLVAVLAIGSVATIAYSGYGTPKVVVEGNYIEAVQPVAESSVADENLGAGVANFETSEMVNMGGNIIYTYVGRFLDASTTIVAIPSPFKRATTSAADVLLAPAVNGFAYTSATSTVDLIRLNITGAATSSYTVSCGASAGISTADTDSLLDTTAPPAEIATSSTGVLENGLTAALGGLDDGGTVQKITLNSTLPFFVCKVTSVYPGAFTETTNTFDGKYTVRISAPDTSTR